MKIPLKMPVGELIKFIHRQALIHGKNITIQKWIKFMEGNHDTAIGKIKGIPTIRSTIHGDRGRS